MNETITKLNDRVYLHTMYTEKFKTNLVASFVLVDLNKEEITQNTLIPAVLKRGTNAHPTMRDISNAMDDMYGAIFDASSDKLGSKQALQFYISVIDDQYALNQEKLLQKSISLLKEIMFEPKLVNGTFDKDYVEQEKAQLLELIKSKINDKGAYAVFRSLEELFPNDPYGVYKYGREEDISKMNEVSLYQQYQKVMAEGEIHFYVAGRFEESEVMDQMTKEFSFIKDTSDAQNYFAVDKSDLAMIDGVKKVRDVGEVIQGKLVLTYDAKVDPFSDDLYKVYVYNAILGSSAMSKLFQNVREKKSMAYTIRSTYLKHKALMLITAGIEMDKYEKALEYIKKEVQDMNEGNFSEEDVINAKTFLVNLFRTYTDDETTMVSLSMGQFLLGMEDSIEGMIAKIQKVTKDEIIQIAHQMELKLEYYLGN